LDEILQSKLSRVHPDLVRENVGHTLDSVNGLSHSERATIGDASRRFVSVDTVNFDVRGFEIIRPRADMKQTGGKLRGIRCRICVTMIGDGLDAQGRDRAVFLSGKLSSDVIIARERIGLKVL